MSTITRPDQAIETSSSHGSLLERLKAMQSVWILGVLVVIVAVFGIMRPTIFLSAGNLTNIMQNVSIWAVLAVGHDLRHHHLGHRPVGRLGAGRLVGRRRQDDGGHGR